MKGFDYLMEFLWALLSLFPQFFMLLIFSDATRKLSKELLQRIVRALKKEQHIKSWLRNIERQKNYGLLRGSINGDKQFYNHLTAPLKKNPILLQEFNEKMWVLTYRKMIGTIYAWYSIRGIRSISAWDEHNFDSVDAFLEGLIDFLFGNFEVMPIVKKVWHHTTTQALNEEWRKWVVEDYRDQAGFEAYFFLAQGGSLRDTSFFQFRVSRSVAAKMKESTTFDSIGKTYWWAEAKVAGLPNSLAQELANHNPDLSEGPFLKKLLRIAAKSSNGNISWDQFRVGINLIRLIKFGTGIFSQMEVYQPFVNRQPDFQLVSKNWFQLYRKLEQLITVIYPSVRGIPDQLFYTLENGNKVSIRRIVNQAELIEEGKLLHHCVGDGSYHFDCINQFSSIWSMSYFDNQSGVQQRLTIELAGNIIEEVKSFYNSEPNNLEWESIQKWANEYNLTIEL